MRNDREHLDALKGRCSIIALAVHLGLDVTGRTAACFNRDNHRGGRDRNPSLTFYESDQDHSDDHFHCFSCGIHGDAFDLVQQIANCDFREAMEYIEDFVVGNSPLRRAPAQCQSRSQDPKIVAAVFTTLFDSSEELTDSSPAGRYLAGRGIGPSTANRLGVREVRDADGLAGILRQQHGDDELQQAGLLRGDDGLLFDLHPLLFFYRQDGSPVYVQARAISGDVAPKELKPKALTCPVPFNVNALSGLADGVVLAEGAIDTVSAIEMGHIALGVPGVQAFRPEWYGLFQNVASVKIAFDGDEAGRNASLHLEAGFLLRGIPCEVVDLPDGEDVNDVLRNGGSL